MTLSEWQVGGKYFDYKNHQIFYREEGQRETLLLIHGFPTSSWDWHKMWGELSSRFNVIALDMLGFGFSEKPKDHSYSIAEQADIVEALLHSKSLTKVKIIAHDYGNTVAQELLARHDAGILKGKSQYTIESLCFLNGGLFPMVHRPLLVQKLLASPFGFIATRFSSRYTLALSFRMIFGPKTQASKKEIDEFWSIIKYNKGNLVSHLLIKYMKERTDNEERWVGAIRNTSVPLRLIDGLLDPISGKHLVEKYKEVIPNPDVVELKEIGHFPLLESPFEVLEHYFDFVNKTE